MGVIKKKPYEISIWEDRLVTENEISYYKEIKLAVIGSDKMESPNRAFDPVLTENVNGEKTLTFCLAFKYYDEYTGEIVQNPFYPYLINERKVKLFYNNEWSEFVIKECNETSTENIFRYTAKELFSLELAKLGYDVTLDTELNNNQGTIIELAKRVLENTDWEVDENNSDLLTQYVQEPLYEAVLTNQIEVLNLDTNKLVTLNKDEVIYIFYSYINNKTTDNVQFIRKDEEDFFIDDDNVIKSTNYRILSSIAYEIDTETQEVSKITNIADVNGLYLQNQGYRLVYKIQTTYDPIMNRTVEIYQMPYKGQNQEIYHFLDYNYTASDIVVSYITNGSDFQLYEDGKLQGWYNTTPTTSTDERAAVLQPISVVTYPVLEKGHALRSLDTLSEINGYLELKFNDVLTSNYENTYLNLGFEHSRSIIDHISKGEEFVLRMRYYSSDKKLKDSDKVEDVITVAAGATETYTCAYTPYGEVKLEFSTRINYERVDNTFTFTNNTNNSVNVTISYGYIDEEDFEKHVQVGAPDVVEEGKDIKNKGLRVIVAKYETVEKEYYVTQEAKEKEETSGKSQISKVKTYEILPSDIVLDFNEAFVKSKNIISNGIFAEDDTDHRRYLVDNVVQVPSTAYIYKVEGDETEYLWNVKEQKYVPRADDSLFADYYLTTAKAKYSFTNEQMNDPKFKMGIFLYTKDADLAERYIYVQDIQLTRCYRDGNEKIVTLGNVPTAVSQEAHHYYLKPNGQKTDKEITTYGSLKFLAEELGANEDTIVPVFNEQSEKILSVQASNSNYFNILQDLCEKFECWLDIRVEHEEDGSIKLDKDYNPIKRVAFKEYAGKDNFAGFKNGINLTGITRNIDSNEIVTKLIVEPVQSEYSNTGSIDIQRAKTNPSGQSYILNLSYYMNRGLITDVAQCNKDINNYNIATKKLNEQIVELQDKFVLQSNSLTKISAQRNTYTALISEAEKQYNEALERFQQLTDWEYNAFVNQYQNVENWAKSEEVKDKNYLENDTVMDTVGEIYIASVTLNNYSGLLTNLDKSYQDLSLECYGAKEYGISVVFKPGVEGGDEVEEIYPSTQVVVDDYVSGLQFQLIDVTGSSVLYQTSPNQRVFDVSNESPYKYIRFLQLPEHYNLKYYKADGTEKILSKDKLKINIQIYDDVEEETYNRRFTLVPDEDYLEQHLGTQRQIEKLIEDKKQVEKNFYKKYSRFLQEGTWSSQDYIDPELYYFDALQVSNTSAQPKVSYTIDVLEVSQIEGLENYDFRVGDKTYIEDVEFFGYLYQAADVRAPIKKGEDESDRAPIDGEITYENDLPVVITARSPVREEVVVSEVEWHFDEPDNNTITVQNYKTRFEDLFQRISATVQAVQRNEITYPKTSSILDKSGLINSNLLADSLNEIGGVGFALTTNGSVAATEDGLLIRDLLNPANMMRVTSAGIQITADGGENWGTALNAMGISTDTLTAGTINTQRIWLMDGDNPSFRWDKAGLNAYGLDEEGNQVYDLKTYVRFDKYGLYGIKNDEDYVASSLDDVRQKAYFGVTWDGFFIKNSYTDGEVSITSDDDIVVKQNGQNRIKIGAVEKDASGAPTKYGINIMNDNGDVVFDTGDDGNISVTGTINALAGNFTGRVVVGEEDKTHILIDGTIDNPIIQSSNYSDGAGTGWIIDSNGDATFSNVSVRGAIKTAVFEYEEIQAVGGAFLFRPSSTIKSVRYQPSIITVVDDETQETKEVETYYHYDEEDTEQTTPIYNDLIVVVEKPLMFRKDNWVKLSNYNSLGADPADDLTSYGLVHIYKVKNIIVPADESYELITLESGDNPYELGLYELFDNVYILTTDTAVDNQKSYYQYIGAGDYLPYEIILDGGAKILDTASIESIAGGALIDFGNHQTTIDAHGQIVDIPGTQNYGIGINSSDNYVNLPARAISLFETTIHPDEDIKVTYNYRGILGTLPRMEYEGDNIQVAELYHKYMEGTQGIYTDNMYIGNENQYLAFYTDNNGNKHLKISAKEIIYEIDETTQQEITWEQKINEAEGTQTIMVSTLGTEILNNQEIGAVYVKVIQGDGEVDSIVADDYLGVGIETPSINSEYLGYIKFDSNNHYISNYYYREDVTHSWNLRNIQQGRYEWTFKDANNVLITQDTIASGGIHSNIHDSIKYIINNSETYHPQFIYLDANVVDKKIIMYVKVTI